MKVKQLIPIFVLSIVLLPLASGGEREETTLITPPWNHCLGLHKVTQFHLDLYSAYSTEFNDPQGLFCTKLDSENDPGTERDDDELTVFGLDSGAHLLIYNKGLTSIGIIGGEGEGQLQFRNPVSLSGDEKGNVYVADSGNGRIVHLRYTGNRELVYAGEIQGPEGNLLDRPTGVAFSGGKIYVADSGNDRIAVFGVEGGLQASFTPATEEDRLFRPFSVAAVTEGDEWLYYRDYYIAVVDSLGRRIWKLSPEGEVLGIIRYNQSEGGFGHVAVDYYGNIYATDPHHGCIHKFNRHLEYIVAFGASGTHHNQLDEPRGITIYRRFGQIFVSERAGAQYYWIGTDIIRFSAKNLSIYSSEGRLGVDVSFLLTEHSFVSLHLEDEQGNERIRVLDDYLLPAGLFERRLELPSTEMELLANCKLRLVIVAKPTYSSRAYLEVRKKSRLLETRLSSHSE
jgi:hypothetical protein